MDNKVEEEDEKGQLTEVEMQPAATTIAMEAPTDEGDGQVTTTVRPVELADDSASNDGLEEDDGDDAMNRFLDGDRPTSAGEPSHNVPRTVVINAWCIFTSVLLVVLFVFMVVTLFAPRLFQTSIQNMLHFMVDENRHISGEGGLVPYNMLMVVFCVTNTAWFCMCGNIDYLLMVACGYLYGDDSNQWVTGAVVYVVANYIGCCVTFLIGRTLFKDRLYALFSKYERYRYFQCALTDNSLLLSIALNLNPFLPSGLIVYALSTCNMTWLYFAFGQAARIPNAAIMCYAGYWIRQYGENEPLENTNIDDINIDYAYTSNSITYTCTVIFCVMFAVLLLCAMFAIYLQFQRLVLGDALRKAEQDASDTETNSGNSVTDSNEDVDGSDDEDEEDYSSSSESSGNTYDEYGASNGYNMHKKTESFLFQDEYAPAVADHSESEHSNAVAGEQSPAPNGAIETTPKKKRRRRKKSKHRLDTDGGEARSKKRKKKKRKKSKKRKLNNTIWQTIVLATSPTEAHSMLFEEGDTKPQPQDNYFGHQQDATSLAMSNKTNGAGAAKATGKSSKNGGAGNASDAELNQSEKSSARAAFDTFTNFFKKPSNEGKDGDASSQRGS